jgi:hypothetical protein
MGSLLDDGTLNSERSKTLRYHLERKALRHGLREMPQNLLGFSARAPTIGAGVDLGSRGLGFRLEFLA